jgi:hypothetical protein
MGIALFRTNFIRIFFGEFLMKKLHTTSSGNDSCATADIVPLSENTGTVPHRWMRDHAMVRTSHYSLNPYQLTSLSAMIAYSSFCSGQSEFRIERSLSDHFRVPNPKFLPANDFDNAIRYLAEIIHG